MTKGSSKNVLWNGVLKTNASTSQKTCVSVLKQQFLRQKFSRRFEENQKKKAQRRQKNLDIEQTTKRLTIQAQCTTTIEAYPKGMLHINLHKTSHDSYQEIMRIHYDHTTQHTTNTFKF